MSYRLVVEPTTVYEIDEECLRKRERERQKREKAEQEKEEAKPHKKKE